MRNLLMLATLTVSVTAAASPNPGATAPSARTDAAPITIVALGDSLTSGHRLGTTDAYPSVLQALLHDAGVPAVVVNHGVSGDTTARGLRRLRAALDERPRILIVALGANDGLAGVPVAQVRKNLEEIIETAQARDIRVLLCGMEALPIGGWQYTIAFHQIFPDLAARYGVPLVPFLLDGVIGNPDLMSADGIHPNAAGARIMAANIWPYLRPLVTGLQATQ